MSKPKIALAALGGTLSMQQAHGGQGVLPTLDGETLLASIPEINDLAQIQVQTLSLLPSASLDFAFLLQVLDWANQQVEQGAEGVIITQGTDTLEESAAFFQYLWAHDAPLVLTGAMRSAGQTGADGPANLLDACRVVVSKASRLRAVQVVMNGQIHEALHVRKSHTLALQAFTSPTVGPAGLLVEGNVRYLRPAPLRLQLPSPTRTTQKVALLQACLSADTLLLEQLLALGYEGLVIAGFGAGHVSESWANALAPIAAKIPVIVGSRTGAGPTACATYGFVGGEIDLQSKGLHLSGMLCPRKARVLLWLLLGGAGVARLSACLDRSF